MQRVLAASRQLLPRAQQQMGALTQLQSAGGFAAVRLFSTEADSHDDFKPQVKAAPSSSVDEQIESSIKSHDIFVFMKGVPEAPMCGFSNMVCRILDAYEVEYGSSNVLADDELREGVKRFTAWPTIPQVFVRGEFVGGSDILYDMHQKGELRQLLEASSSGGEKQS